MLSSSKKILAEREREKKYFGKNVDFHHQLMTETHQARSALLIRQLARETTSAAKKKKKEKKTALKTNEPRADC